MSQDPRGTIIQQGNLLRINNAFVEEVFCFRNTEGYMLVSYSVPGENNTVSIQNIQLNFNRGTVILNPLGRRICQCCVQAGMWVNVVFSAQMTRSIPPQSNVFFVAVRRNVNTPPASSVTTGRITLIDFDNQFLYTEDPRNPDNQIKFIFNDATTVSNRFGAPIRIDDLQPGEMVRITHANFMTASIPPQTTAFHIRLL